MEKQEKRKDKGPEPEFDEEMMRSAELLRNLEMMEMVVRLRLDEQPPARPPKQR